MPPTYRNRRDHKISLFSSYHGTANYWKGQYNQAKQKNEDLKLELESTYARIRNLKQRLFGKKTEQGVAVKRDSSGRYNHIDTPRPRG